MGDPQKTPSFLQIDGLLHFGQNPFLKPLVLQNLVPTSKSIDNCKIYYGIDLVLQNLVLQLSNMQVLAWRGERNDLDK